MFTGIIEAQAKTKEITAGDKVLRISIEKPSHFNDLKIGDSVSVNGVCLTIESILDNHFTFSIAKETLDVTNWNKDSLKNMIFNLERPMLANSRIHGHWVTGHVDTVLKVIAEEHIGENKIIKIEMPDQNKNFIIEKGSVTLNGVALTVNEVSDEYFSVCLIPETLKMTNLSQSLLDLNLNIEFDYLVKIVNKSLKFLKKGDELNKSKDYSHQLRGQDA